MILEYLVLLTSQNHGQILNYLGTHILNYVLFNIVIPLLVTDQIIRLYKSVPLLRKI